MNKRATVSSQHFCVYVCGKSQHSQMFCRGSSTDTLADVGIQLSFAISLGSNMHGVGMGVSGA
jgi:hypothetical protein